MCNGLSKILAKVVRTRIIDHVKECSILSPSQYSEKILSAIHSMINLLETSLSTLDKGLKTGSIYLDIIVI